MGAGVAAESALLYASAAMNPMTCMGWLAAPIVIEVSMLPPDEFPCPLNMLAATLMFLAIRICVPESLLRCWMAVALVSSVNMPTLLSAPQPQMAAACSALMAVTAVFVAATMGSIACTGPWTSPMGGGLAPRSHDS